jgi:hypothetical protein
MGVEYEHYLVPDDPAYKPDASQISRLINALHDHRYVRASDASGLDAKTFEWLSPEYEARSSSAFAKI